MLQRLPWSPPLEAPRAPAQNLVGRHRQRARVAGAAPRKLGRRQNAGTRLGRVASPYFDGTTTEVLGPFFPQPSLVGGSLGGASM
jgi:hypothetical protein